MPQTSAGFKNSITGKIFLILGISILLFWITGQLIDVYHFAFVGAVYEMLWLPMLAMLFILPALSFIFWSKDKFIIRSFFFYTLLILIATIVLMLFKK